MREVSDVQVAFGVDRQCRPAVIVLGLFQRLGAYGKETVQEIIDRYEGNV